MGESVDFGDSVVSDRRFKLPDFDVPLRWLVLTLGFFGSFVVAAKPALESFLHVPSSWSAYVALAIAFVSTILLARWFRVRSTLERPEDLLIEPDDSRATIGRKDDLTVIVNLCRQYRHVTLTGPAGIGKTALLRAGVMRRLENDTELRPVYVNLLEESWLERLSTELRDRFPEATAAGEEVHSAASQLTGISQVTGRTPLLLLDSAGEYASKRGAPELWKKTADQRERMFWTQLGSEADAGRVQVLFVTRNGEVSLIRSRRSTVYTLTGIDASYVPTILSDLARNSDKETVVSNPERGWSALSRMLASDLGRGWQVSPADLRVSLQTLTDMAALTPAAYRWSGRVNGLVAGYVDRVARRTAAPSGLEVAAIFELLYELVPDTFFDGTQGRSIVRALKELEGNVRTIDALTEVVSNLPLRGARVAKDGTLEDDADSTERTHTRVFDALTRLEAYQVVEERIAPDGTCVWGVFNDLMARGISLARERRMLWPDEELERARSWRDSGWNVVSRVQSRIRFRRLVTLLRKGWPGRFTSAHRWYVTANAVMYLFALAGLVAASVAVATGTLALIDLGYGPRWVEPVRDATIPYVRLSYPDDKIRQSAASQRRELIAMITGRQELGEARHGWIALDGSDIVHKDPWTQAQTACALARAPETAADTSAVRDALGALFAEQRLSDGDKVDFGWPAQAGQSFSRPEPVLWARAALVNAARPTITTDSRIRNGYDAWRASADRMALNYEPVADARGWRLASRQVDVTRGGTYPTALALLADLDAIEASLACADKEEIGRVNALARWLATSADPAAGVEGSYPWDVRRSDGTASAAPGLTLQISRELIRAHRIAGYPLPADLDLASNVPRYLEAAADANVDLSPAGETFDWIDVTPIGTTTGGSGITVLLPTRYLWYPWAVACAAEYLSCAETDPEFAAHADRVRRVLGRLVVDHGPRFLQLYKQSKAPTYYLSETLYAMSDVDKIRAPR